MTRLAVECSKPDGFASVSEITSQQRVTSSSFDAADASMLGLIFSSSCLQIGGER